MLILARGGRSYARLQFRAGPGAALEVPVRVDYDAPFPAADREGWQREYRECVQPVILSAPAEAQNEPAASQIGNSAGEPESFSLGEQLLASGWDLDELLHEDDGYLKEAYGIDEQELRLLRRAARNTVSEEF